MDEGIALAPALLPAHWSMRPVRAATEMDVPAPAADTLAHAEARASEDRPAFPAALETARAEQSASVARESPSGARGEKAGEVGDEREGDGSATAVASAAIVLPVVDSLVPFLTLAGAQPRDVSAGAAPAPEAEAAGAPSGGGSGDLSQLQQILAGAGATAAESGAIAARPGPVSAAGALPVLAATAGGGDSRSAAAAGTSGTIVLPVVESLVPFLTLAGAQPRDVSAGAAPAPEAEAAGAPSGGGSGDLSQLQQILAGAGATAAESGAIAARPGPVSAAGALPVLAATAGGGDSRSAAAAGTSGTIVQRANATVVPPAGSAGGTTAAASGSDPASTAAGDGTGGTTVERANATVTLPTTPPASPPARHVTAAAGDSAARAPQRVPESGPPPPETPAAPRDPAVAVVGRRDHAGGPTVVHAAPVRTDAMPAATADPAPGARALAQPVDGVPGRGTTSIAGDAVAAASGDGTRAQGRETAHRRDAGAEPWPGAEPASAGRAATKSAAVTAAERRVQTPVQLAAGAGRITDCEQRVAAAEARLAEVDSLVLPEGGRGSQSLATAGAGRVSSTGETRVGIDAPAGLTAWAERVVDALRLATARGGGEMRLRLEPEGLGHIDVRISLAHDGVRAVLVAEHDATRTLLANGQHLLQAALERSDLRLAGFSVDLGFGAGSGAGAESDGRSGAMPGVPEALIADEAARPGAESIPIAGPPEPGRLSLRV